MRVSKSMPDSNMRRFTKWGSINTDRYVQIPFIIILFMNENLFFFWYIILDVFYLYSQESILKTIYFAVTDCSYQSFLNLFSLSLQKKKYNNNNNNQGYKDMIIACMSY